MESGARQWLCVWVGVFFAAAALVATACWAHDVVLMFLGIMGALNAPYYIHQSHREAKKWATRKQADDQSQTTTIWS